MRLQTRRKNDRIKGRIEEFKKTKRAKKKM
jgi:hypothetical protein